MILYKITCANGHGYASWFKDAATFELLSDSNRLECPHCHLRQMDRAVPLSYEGEGAPFFASRDAQIQIEQPSMDGEARGSSMGGSLLSLLEAHIVLRRLEEIRQQIEQYFHQFTENSLFRKKGEDEVHAAKVEKADAATEILGPAEEEADDDAVDSGAIQPTPVVAAATKKSTENA